MSSFLGWMTVLHWLVSTAVHYSVSTSKPHPQEVPEAPACSTARKKGGDPHGTSCSHLREAAFLVTAVISGPGGMTTNKYKWQ